MDTIIRRIASKANPHRELNDAEVAILGNTFIYFQNGLREE